MTRSVLITATSLRDFWPHFLDLHLPLPSFGFCKVLKVVCPWDQALCPAHPVVYIKMQILLALMSLCLKLVP